MYVNVASSVGCVWSLFYLCALQINIVCLVTSDWGLIFVQVSAAVQPHAGCVGLDLALDMSNAFDTVNIHHYQIHGKVLTSYPDDITYNIYTQQQKRNQSIRTAISTTSTDMDKI